MKTKITVITVILWFVIATLGTWLSIRRPLWTDEMHTQVNALDRYSYKEILQFKMYEGNRCPIFYVVQKGLCDVFGYRFPADWRGWFNFSDLRSQIILRVPANLYMTSAIVLIFYFFARHYGLGIGIYALLWTLASFMVWLHWAEARYYSLWFLLTTIQSLTFIRALDQEDLSSSLKNLTIIHILLSLTMHFSLIQIAIVSFLLWLYKEKNLRSYLWMTIIPIVICLFYYINSKELYFWLANESANQVQFLKERTAIYQQNMVPVLDCYPYEQMVFLLALGVLFVMKRLRQKEDGEKFKIERIHCVWMTLTFLSSLVLLFAFVKWTTMEVLLPSRYFIYVTPVGIITTVLFSMYFVRIFQENKWPVTYVMICCTGLLILRMMYTFDQIYKLGVY